MWHHIHLPMNLIHYSQPANQPTDDISKYKAVSFTQEFGPLAFIVIGFLIEACLYQRVAFSGFASTLPIISLFISL